MTDEILTLKDVAALLKVAEKTVYTMAQRREIPCFKMRGQWRFRRRDLEAWLEALSLSETKPSSPLSSSTLTTLTIKSAIGKTHLPHQPLSPQTSSSTVYVFGDYELDDRLCELRQAGQPIAIEPKVFDVLSYLIRHRGRIVSKDELLKQLWTGQVVVEAALTRCVSEARTAVRDNGVRQQVIKTQRGRGYRFVATVIERLVSASGRDAPAERFYISEGKQPAVAVLSLPSLTVLPFVSLSGDPAQNYCSDALTEDLITDLAKLPGLVVFSDRAPATRTRNATQTTGVNRELGTQYVLTGSVRTAGKRMQITVQLADNATGRRLWAERYDRPLRDLFALLEEVRRKIVVHLGLTLTDTYRWVVDREYSSNPQAYDLFLQGRAAYYCFTRATNAQARQFFKRALELDPTYTLACEGLGWTYWLEWACLWNQQPRTLERALMLAQQARTLDGSLASTHMLLGWVYLWKKQHEQAIAEGRQAIAFDPNGAYAYRGLGSILNFAGRPEEAVQLIEHAMRLDPRKADLYVYDLGLAYYLLGRNDEALTATERVLTYNAGLLAAHTLLAVLYSECGREQEARAAIAQALHCSPLLSLAGVRKVGPYKEPTMLERVLKALHKAGLQ
jgi:excisionase family DNA binding protein